MPEPGGTREVANVQLKLECDGFSFEAGVTVPVGPLPRTELLPLARALSAVAAKEAATAAEGHGETVSCQKGCTACCRHLVALSEIEARRLARHIAALPEQRRNAICDRFAELLRGLDARLLAALRQIDSWTAEHYRAIGGFYFEQGIDCPFLENDACTIYEERPFTCRELLVTSPPEHCAVLDSDKIKPLRLPLKMFNAVARLQTPPTLQGTERVVPLVLLLEWNQAHPEEPEPISGVELLKELLGHLRGEPATRQ